MAEAQCPFTPPSDDHPRSSQSSRTCGRLLRRSLRSFAGLCLLLLSSICSAQNGGFPPAFPNAPIQAAPGEDIGIDPATRLKQIEAINKERYKEMVSDAEKLLKLTAELNAQINSAHPGGLTVKQLHMVDEIAKLAHSIRDKMLNPVGMPMNPPGMSPAAGPGGVFPGQLPRGGIYGR